MNPYLLAVAIMILPLLYVWVRWVEPFLDARHQARYDDLDAIYDGADL